MKYMTYKYFFIAATFSLLGVFFYPMLFVGIGKLFKYEEKRDALISSATEETDDEK